MNSEKVKIEKLNLITWITQLQDISLIEKLKEFQLSVTKPSDDWYNLLSEEQKLLIQQSMKEHKNGETFSDTEARKQLREFILSKKS